MEPRQVYSTLALAQAVTLAPVKLALVVRLAKRTTVLLSRKRTYRAHRSLATPHKEEPGYVEWPNFFILGTYLKIDRTTGRTEDNQIKSNCDFLDHV